MEVLAAVLLALPTVFLGAFLAVLLDGARERMRTRRWVMRNLHNFVDRAQRGPVPPAGAALRAWLSATTAEDLDEEAWRQAWFLSVSTAPDLAPLLRSEAATSVPVEVFNALGAVEEEAETLKRFEPYVKRHVRAGRGAAVVRAAGTAGGAGPAAGRAVPPAARGLPADGGRGLRCGRAVADRGRDAGPPAAAAAPGRPEARR